MKQTAVEWLTEQLNLIEWIEDDGMPDIQLEILRQAIEMEIRQIQDACFEALKNEIIEIKEISDQDIKNIAWDKCNMEHPNFDNTENYVAFVNGAKWYREQLKTKI